MNYRLAVVLAALASLPVGAAHAQDQEPGDERDPAHAKWPWFAEVSQPELASRWYALYVPATVLGKAAADLRDLRLADANGVRVPFVLRVLQAKTEHATVPIVRQFDAAASEKNRFFQVSLELGDLGPGHNEIEIDTGGTNFRRRVQVFGDKTERFEDPRLLLAPDKYLVHFDTDAGVVQVKRFSYPFTRFRFLQVRIYADPVADKEIPSIQGVHVRRKIVTPGTYTAKRGILQPRQDVRTDEGPGSAWFLDFEEALPVEMLRFALAGDAVERPHRVQVANPGEPRLDQVGSEWHWQPGKEADVLEVRLRQEVIARRLRFVVTDFANLPLNLDRVEAVAAVRQVIFELPQEKAAWPLRLYFGNASAGPTRYDLERTLPPVLQPAPVQVGVGMRQANPAYQPPTPPLHERQPWLIYLVLGGASAVLLMLLLLLARQALAARSVREADRSP